MLFYNASSTKPNEVYDAKFFAQGTEVDVIVRDADGNPVKNADGSVQTVRGELRDLLVPFAAERFRLLAKAADNQRQFVAQGNNWVAALSRALTELEKFRPVGKDGQKAANLSEGYNFKDKGNPISTTGISAETANTLRAMRGTDNVPYLSKFFSGLGGAGMAELAAYALAHPSEGPGFEKFNFTQPVTIGRMADKQAWGTFDNAFKSAVDQATQKVQLDQATFQGLVSRQNNAIETMADLQQKFAGTFQKLIDNSRLGK